MVPTSRLLAGFDIPYMPVSIGPAMQAIRTWEGFDQRDVERIVWPNAPTLLPGVEARRGRLSRR